MGCGKGRVNPTTSYSSRSHRTSEPASELAGRVCVSARANTRRHKQEKTQGCGYSLLSTVPPSLPLQWALSQTEYSPKYEGIRRYNAFASSPGWA
jgi:hypothetical protein